MERKLTPRELREVQKTELEILQEIDRICRKNRIRYCVIAGTMLGAVRGGGFIPWDDDADVGMLRPEYDRFVAACKRDLDETRFLFQDHHVTPGYRWGYGKMRRRDTLFLRHGQEHMPYDQGIFVDVFPLDTVPNCWAGRAIMNLRCFVVRKFLWARVGRVSERRAAIRWIYRLMDHVPEEKILRHYDRMVEGCGRETDWVRILMFPTPNRAFGYLRRWYEDPKDVCFEGILFPGVSEPDAYLRFKYGAYETLPPPEERRVHPVSDLRLLPEAEDQVKEPVRGHD